MYKEIIISTVIIFSIFFLDYITQKYTDKTINTAIKDLTEIKGKIAEDNVDKEKVLKEIDEKYEKWLGYHKKLAFYIEHNELEKVETDYIAGKNFIEVEEYESAFSELSKTIFILEHIHDKYSIKWANIF